MKLGGSGELWMMVGPLIAVGLLVGLGADGVPLARLAQDLASDGWATAVRVFRP